MNKCKGCGALLQNENKEKEGFSKNIEDPFCERCFRIKHYSEYKNIIKTNDDFKNILKKIEESKDLVVLLVDILDMENVKKINIKNDVILVITKKDIYPRDLYKNISLKPNLNIKKQLVISTVKNYNLDELLNEINKYKKGKNVYVMGFTNAGKSTLINKMVKNYSNEKDNLTVSFLPSTTLDFLKVKINDSLTLIDTPGLIDEGNICNYVSPKTLKEIIPVKEIKPKIYQVKVKQSIIVGDILRVDAEKNNLIFVMSNALKYERIYKETDRLKNLSKIELNVLENSEIVIKGLGFIKVKNKEKITIYTVENVDVYVR